MASFKELIKKYWVIIKSVGFNVPEKTVVNTGKDSKLLVAQIHADFVHTRHNLSLSYILAVVVTGIFAIFTLNYENLFSKKDSTVFLLFLLGHSFFSHMLRELYVSRANKQSL